MKRLLALALVAFLFCSCTKKNTKDSLTVAVNAGVEGLALKEAAQEWSKKTGTEIQIVELPYGNLFEKELLDLKSKTGAYDVIMLDDPWFPQFSQSAQLASLDDLYKLGGAPGPTKIL